MEKICEAKTKIILETEKIINKSGDFCVVDYSKRTFDFVRRESCGKCVLCREGTLQIYRIIDDATSGTGESDDIELLKELSEVLSKNAGCELAREAADNLLINLSEQLEEWELHIKRKRCSALVCKKYITIHVLPDKCQGCEACRKVCPEVAILGDEGLIHVISQEKCNQCGICIEVCKYDAIQKAGAVKPKTPEEPIPVGSFEAGGGRRRRRG